MKIPNTPNMSSISIDTLWRHLYLNLDTQCIRDVQSYQRCEGILLVNRRRRRMKLREYRRLQKSIFKKYHVNRDQSLDLLVILSLILFDHIGPVHTYYIYTYCLPHVGVTTIGENCNIEVVVNVMQSTKTYQIGFNSLSKNEHGG